MSRPPAQDPSLPSDGEPPLQDDGAPQSGRPRRPWGVSVGALVLSLESLSLLVAGAFAVAAIFNDGSGSLGGGLFLAVLLVGLGAGLAAVAVQFYRGYRWTRSAAFVWQLLMLTVAVPTLLSGFTVTGFLLLVPPLALLVLLFTPAVVAFTLRTGGAPVA